MGNSLHNKIYLGRHSVLSSRWVQVALAIGVLAAAALALLASQH
ncbi:hypothetical protein [Massilia horti]|nr:hypothetical protein [Massilia horti]